jgi:cob(I)alamin adenosyltransferase
MSFHGSILILFWFMLCVFARRSVMKIYTRTGDKGTSSLYTGERRAKDDPVFETLGTIDELTSFIGMASAMMSKATPELLPQLHHIQCQLQDINSNVATPEPQDKQSAAYQKYVKVLFDVSGKQAPQLEQWIDEMDTKLPPLTQFILPGGSQASSAMHVARTCCRRAERRITQVVKQGGCSSESAIFMNRLSDYLFTAARYIAHQEGCKDVIYQKTT